MHIKAQIPARGRALIPLMWGDVTFSEIVLEFRKEKKVGPEDIPKFMNAISQEHENEWLIFLSNGEIISNKSLEKALNSLKEKKNVRIATIVKAPSKKGVMFR